MSITTLYAELVVVGTGALLFVLLSFYAFFGEPSWVPKLSANSIESVISLIPVLSVIYLLGIIVVNISHRIFDGPEQHLRKRVLGNINYEQLRNELYTSADVQNLVHDFEFRRSKVRICRGWYLNCLLIMVALLACFGNGRISLVVTVFWCMALGLLAVGALISWQTATATELDWLRSFAQHRNKVKGAQQPLPPFIDS
ncbi:MAG TPA: hypothetical protein VLA93_18085 [Pyrinomonadaceae bacterium]|nr:hypothetical protein [Pyrinomonadaceae bacterium]